MGHVCTLLTLVVVLSFDLGQRSHHWLISRPGDQRRHRLLVSEQMTSNFVGNSVGLNEGRSGVGAGVQAVI